MRRGLVALVVAGSGVAVGILSLRVAARDPTFSFAGSSLSGRLALACAGWACTRICSGDLADWKPSWKASISHGSHGVPPVPPAWWNPGYVSLTVTLPTFAPCGSTTIV